MIADTIIRPDWEVANNVFALSTSRGGGVSEGPWSSLNLGDHCGDDAAAVRENRQRLVSLLPGEPTWLRQVHGIHVFDADARSDPFPVADASVTSMPGRVLAILTADCLPVLFCTKDGSRIGAAHAGWRGLSDGVIEATVEAMDTSPDDIIAWLGPCIGQTAYEVGDDDFESFSSRSGSDLVESLRPAGDKWHLGLTAAARLVLAGLGVNHVFVDGGCTFEDESRFFSYRRDGVTGRMATLVWLGND